MHAAISYKPMYRVGDSACRATPNGPVTGPREYNSGEANVSSSPVLKREPPVVRWLFISRVKIAKRARVNRSVSPILINRVADIHIITVLYELQSVRRSRASRRCRIKFNGRGIFNIRLFSMGVSYYNLLSECIFRE